MNIFVSDSDPVISAQNLDDKRVKHMPRESFEMISMAYYKNTGVAIAPFIIWDRERRANNNEKFNELFNHKCTNWVASKRENMCWLWRHAIALLDEYQYRHDKSHLLYSLFISISHYIPIIKKEPKSFVNATPFEGKTVFDSYKEVLNYKWFVTDEVKPVIWTKRGRPSWAKTPQIIKQGDLFYNNPYDDLPF